MPPGHQEGLTLWLPSHGKYRATLQPHRHGCPHANRQGHPSPLPRVHKELVVPGCASSALAQLLLMPQAEHSYNCRTLRAWQLPAPHHSWSSCKGQHCPLRCCHPQSSVWEGKRIDMSLQPAMAAQPPKDAPSALLLLSTGTAQGSAEVPAQPGWSSHWHLPTQRHQPLSWQQGYCGGTRRDGGGTGSTHACPLHMRSQLLPQPPGCPRALPKV